MGLWIKLIFYIRAQPKIWLICYVSLFVGFLFVYFALCIFYKFIHNLTFESDSFLYLSRTVCQVIDCMCQLYRLDLYLFLQQFWVVNNLRNNIVYFLIDCLVSLLCLPGLCLLTSIFTILSFPSLALSCASFFIFLWIYKNLFINWDHWFIQWDSVVA